MKAPFTEAFQRIFKLERYRDTHSDTGAPRPDRELAA